MRKIVIPDDKKKQIIKLRESGKNWTQIGEETNIPRHRCKQYYFEWQRQTLADDKVAIRRSLAAEYLKEHLELQVDFAGQLLELIHIPPSKVPEVTPREQLYPLWHTNRLLDKTDQGIQPLVYPKKEGDEEKSKLKMIEKQNELVFQSLKEHTGEQVRWRALDEWMIGWNGCHEAIGEIRSSIRDKLSQEMDAQGSGGRVWKSIGEKVKKGMEDEMVLILWRVLVVSRTEQDLVVPDEIQAAKAFAGYLTGNASGEPVIPSLYLNMVQLVSMEIMALLVQALCGYESIKQLAKNIERMWASYQELEEKLNPMELRPLLLSTRCRLCPV